MARNNKADSLRTREKIVDSAIEVFYQNGWANSSLEDIAFQAGVTRGAIYVHFKNKTALLDSLCEQVILPTECIEGCLSKVLTINSLQVGWKLYLESLVNEPKKHKILSIIYHRCEFGGTSGHLSERLSFGRYKAKSVIESLIEREFRSRHSFEDFDAASAATLMVLSMSSLVESWLIKPQDFDLVKMGLKQFELLVNFVKNLI